MQRRSYLTGIGIAAAVLGASVATAGAIAHDEPEQHREVVIAHGDDRLPSTSATDWVTYADHVVVVRALTEQATAPTRSEIQRGEGLLGRTVRLKVTDVLWSRDNAPTAPKAWNYHASGWVFTDGDPANRTPVALEDQPRVEVGHHYVMAITWEAARCAPGDAPRPARWMGLGEGSQLPFDGGVIGRGENEGRTQTAAQARTQAAGTPGTDRGIEEKLAGRGSAALAAHLNAATPGERQQRGPQPTARC